jgi:hypothetical protein
MVLSKAELVGLLQNEVRILLHLASKIDRAKLDYRPTPKQRSTLDLVRYLSMMGPALVTAVKQGNFDPPAWTVDEKAAEARDFDQAVAAIAAQSATYPKLLADVTDADLRVEVSLFGEPAAPRGVQFVNLLFASCVAYRTQLFLYLKACGREELNTWNLWSGIDPPDQ